MDILKIETDSIFKDLEKKKFPFDFNEDVTNVFEDMLNRSIPFYNEIHKIICDLIFYYTKDNHLIYDLGSSTATTLILLSKFTTSLNKKNISYIGVDNSNPMAQKATLKIEEEKISNIKIDCQNLIDYKLLPSNFIIMNYTLQFIKPSNRLAVLIKIQESLQQNGIFILSEKIDASDNFFNPLITKLYYDFKLRNNYSHLEIAKKREALEDVLIPSTIEATNELLLKARFSHVETIFRWYNFATYLCIK